MIAFAFLSFLPLIEDAMIRQLRDDDFKKREAATKFLSKVLQDTDGYRNYSTLLKIKKAQEHLNPEIRIRARTLYADNRSRYLREYPYFIIMLKKTNIGTKLDKQAGEKIKKICGELYAESERWGRTPDCFFVTCRTENLNSGKLNKLKASKEVIGLVPTTDKMKIPGRP